MRAPLLFYGWYSITRRGSESTMKASTLRTITALAGIVCLALLATTAQAATSITASPYGGTTDTRTGGHGDLTTGVTFDYNGSTSQSVEKILIDTPAGGVGNPNAVPWADRCTKEQFESSTCDAASQIGVVTISAKAYVLGIPIALDNMTGTISEIQTDPEVPTLVGAYIVPSIGDPIRAYAKFYPVTWGADGDFRIRSETDPFPKTANVPLAGSVPIQITKYEQKLFGRLANGNVFITNPTRCDTWNSWGYASFYEADTGLNSDPLGSGENEFIKTDAVPTEPDCSTLAPFNMSADTVVGPAARGGHPDFSTELKIAGLESEPLGGAVPKKVVTTLPRPLTIDVARLTNKCSNEDFAGDSCPAASRVGSVTITTPMIATGLQGEAYLVTNPAGTGLPDLGLRVHGAIDFKLRGSNRFFDGDRIETTFDNIPQVGFSSFKLNLTGGTGGLLMTKSCDSDSEDSPGGRTHFSIASYQGQPIEIDSATTWVSPSCVSYAVKLPRVKKCVKYRRLIARPTFESRDAVERVQYYVKGKRLRIVRRSPFKATLKFPKKIYLRKGRTYRYKAKVFFKPGRNGSKRVVVNRTAKFRLCR